MNFLLQPHSKYNDSLRFEYDKKVDRSFDKKAALWKLQCEYRLHIRLWIDWLPLQHGSIVTAIIRGTVHGTSALLHSSVQA